MKYKVIALAALVFSINANANHKPGHITVEANSAKEAVSIARSMAHQTRVTKKNSPVVYYNALLKCGMGFYTFPNPMFSKEVHSTQDIEVNILGDVGGYCHVNIYFDHAKNRLSCLYTDKMLQDLAKDKNKAAFDRAYNQGYLDSHKVTQYDKYTHEVCESF